MESSSLRNGLVKLRVALTRKTTCRLTGVEIAVDRDHAVAADAPLQPQHGLKRPSRERLELGTLFGKMLGHDAPGRRVDAHIGDLVEPLPELRIEILEITEAAAEEEVLTDIAERALDLAFGLRPIRPTQRCF
jgi:hypothetical protein